MAYKKIMIFGRPGSGKSTFAYELHTLTKIPLYHLDKYFFTSNWVERDYSEFMRMQQEIVNTKSWIIDGNSTKSLETRYSQADICLYFNLSKIICLWRICTRTFHKRSHIDDRAQGCDEVISWKLIKYMWTFEKRAAKVIEPLQLKYPNVKFIEINNKKQLAKILESIKHNF